MSWGKVGNNSGVDRYYQKDTYSSYPYTFGNNVLVEGYAPYKLIDSNFTWESTAMTNLGLELSFFNNRLKMELDLYNKLTTSMIRPGQVSRLLVGAGSTRQEYRRDEKQGSGDFSFLQDQIAVSLMVLVINYSINKNNCLNG